MQKGRITETVDAVDTVESIHVKKRGRPKKVKIVDTVDTVDETKKVELVENVEQVSVIKKTRSPAQLARDEQLRVANGERNLLKAENARNKKTDEIKKIITDTVKATKSKIFVKAAWASKGILRGTNAVKRLRKGFERQSKAF